MTCSGETQRGFGFIEAVIATALLGTGMLVTIQMLTASSDSASAHVTRIRAIGHGQVMLDRIGAELMQSAAEVDPTGAAKLWILDGGRTVRFQRILGTAVDSFGDVSVTWSGDVTITWDPVTRTITRTADGAVTTIAKQITLFDVRRLPDGLIVIELTGERRGPKGQTIKHKGKLRILPRNSLS